MVYNIGICDDETRFISLIENEIKAYFNDKHTYSIHTFQSAAKVLESSLSLDLIFLDIEMPDINGIEIKNKLELIGFKGAIVFVTNYEQYMKDAFGKNVIAYVQKKDIHRLKKILRSFECNQRESKFIKISDSTIKVNDIYYISADNGYCNITTKNKSHYYSIYLNEILRRVDDKLFVQVHRSYIINLRYVDNFNGSEIKIVNGGKIKLSRKYKDQFMKKYFAYLMEE